MMKACSSCGGRMDFEATRCPTCGTPNPTGKKGGFGPGKVVAVLVVLLFLFLVVCVGLPTLIFFANNALNNSVDRKFEELGNQVERANDY